MGKSRRRFITQANGRERGTEGMGDGPAQETMPILHATMTKSRHQQEIRQARKDKQNRWEDE